MMRFKRLVQAAAVSVFALTGAASAATIQFNTPTGWTSGDRVFTNGTESVTVNAATHVNGQQLNFGASVASWSGSAGGLGVCSDLRHSQCREEHTIDSNGPDEVVTLDFGSLVVELLSITFAYVNRDDDFIVYSYGTSFTNLLLSSEERALPNTCSTCTTTNFLSVAGSLFAIGVGGHGDTLKLQAITFNVLPPPSAVPLPAAGWMLLVGLGGLAAWGRRRSAA
jgi:hypothetical protein